MRPFLTTDRLRLRHFTAADAPLLVELDSDPEVMRFLTGGRPTPEAVVRGEILPRIQAAYDEHPGLGRWAAEELSTGAFVGWFGVWPSAAPELGYRLRRSAWGKGYATEGSRALVRKVFTGSDAPRIVAQTMTVNARSRRVMEKCGLRYVRTFFLDWPETIPGGEHGDVEYELLRTDWDAGRGAA